LREKHILRESSKHLLPKGIVNRTKQPYRAPEAQSFLGSNAPGYVADKLSAREIAASGYFDAGAVERLTRKCALGALGQRENMALVGVLSTQLWREAFAPRAALPSFNSAAA
jgi:asparagine synthase (glutamine-hydrolysing)